MAASIVGWAHSPFGKYPEKDLEALIAEVASAAVADAGLGPQDIDCVVLGNYGDAFSAQGFPAPLVNQSLGAKRFTPALRVENACATGSTAIYAGLDRIAAKKARCVLVVGAETMTALPGPQIGGVLLKASYLKEEGATDGGFAGVFGRIAERYFQLYGDQSDALAAIAAKNHRNGCENPYAQLRKDLGFDFCNTVSEKNPKVAGPLRRTDCSLVSDGAAALVLADMETALTLKKAVAFRATAQACDYMPMSRRDVLAFEGCGQVWRQALAGARITLDDLDLVETHDCFTIAELLEYEAMGLTAPGQGARAALEGWTDKDGRLPVNPSGGLKSKGHPIGATGVSMHILAAMQTRGEAGGMQIEGAQLAGVYNMGGTAVSNYASILEALR